MAVTPTTLFDCFEDFAKQSGGAKNMPAFNRAYARVQAPLGRMCELIREIEVQQAVYERARSTDRPMLRQETADLVTELLGVVASLGELMRSPHKKGS